MLSCDFHEKPDVAILIKDSYFEETKLNRYYVQPLSKLGVNQLMALELVYPEKGKLSISAARKNILKLLPALANHGIKYLYVADATYFKALTGQNKADTHLGYVLPCKLKGYEHMQVIFGINYGQLLYTLNASTKLDLTLQTLAEHYQGNYVTRGNIIKTALYPTDDEIDDVLARLKQYPALACDIETTGLELDNELYSIAFAWNQHEGCAFKVINKRQLKLFFESYQGTLIFHNATFDIKHIIYHCFMDNPRDFKGMLHGLHTMCRNIEDTKIIAYLATNNTQGNTLGLKELSHEFVGNYAIDVKNVLNHPLATVLEYNLKDTLATYWVFNKYKPKMLSDNQESIYKHIMLPSIKTIIQIELHGMPMNMDKVVIVKKQLQNQANDALEQIYASEHVKAVTHELQIKELEKINSKLKTKQHTMDKVKDLQFKPNSIAHLAILLYDYLGLPILDYTPNKQPAVSAGTIEKLIQHTRDDTIISLLTALLEYAKVQKILSTFIPAFEKAQEKDDWHYLHGSFNLGGTLSNRLSSSNPNLQQLPSGSTYGKTIKQCFQAPDDWLFVGADFNALEDRINTLLTKDPNKQKIWIDGYDAHCFRAYYYFTNQMPDITNTKESINSIKHKYPELRQESKAPSFALQYGGQYFTLMKNCGFSESKAKEIEANYHKMYEVSDAWTQRKLEQCAKQGYIDVAFGLRIRTPVVGKTVLNTSKTPYLASAEARSVGNAISGQSYCQLTNRAINEFMERVWASEYQYDIMPICLIHDAIYLMIKNDVEIVKWVNDNLIDCMNWQELPEIQHDQIKLEAELGVFYPDWSNEVTLKNHISVNDIIATCSEGAA